MKIDDVYQNNRSRFVSVQLVLVATQAYTGAELKIKASKVSAFKPGATSKGLCEWGEEVSPSCPRLLFGNFFRWQIRFFLP
jgi:hypothetical protein